MAVAGLSRRDHRLAMTTKPGQPRGSAVDSTRKSPYSATLPWVFFFFSMSGPKTVLSHCSRGMLSGFNFGTPLGRKRRDSSQLVSATFLIMS